MRLDGPGDVAADHAIALGERAFDDAEAVHDAFALGDATAARAVEAHGVDFIQVGERVVFLGHVADLRDRRDVTVHGVDGFEHDEFRQRGVEGGETAVEVGRIVMGENFDAGAAVPRTFDHGGVVLRVREHHAAGAGGLPACRWRPSWTYSRS